MVVLEEDCWERIGRILSRKMKPRSCENLKEFLGLKKTTLMSGFIPNQDREIFGVENQDLEWFWDQTKATLLHLGVGSQGAMV